MAIVTAVKSGNWSDPTVWDSNPALPGPGDVVRPATFAVAIDQDVEVAELNGRVTRRQRGPRRGRDGVCDGVGSCVRYAARTA